MIFATCSQSQPILNINIEENFEATCDVVDDVITMKKTF